MKKIIVTILTTITVLSLIACGNTDESSSNEIKEYNIEEFGKILEETNELFEKESEYLTEDELYSEKGYEIYEKCSKKTGLPFKEKIQIRGKKQSSTTSFWVESSDGEYAVGCFYPDGEPNTSYFIKDGENIIVSGIFSEKAGSRGCLTNISFISPAKIDKTYESNITENLKNIDNISGCTVVMGKVDSILTREEFDETMSKMPDSINYTPQDYYDDSVITLKDDDNVEDSSGMITFMYDNKNNDIKVGDQIVISGYLDTLTETKNLDGTSYTWWGFMNNIYEFYKFE